MYAFEIKRRQKITFELNRSLVAIVITFILLVCAFSYETHFFYKSEGFIFFTILCLASISLLISCYHFKNCRWGYDYLCLPVVDDDDLAAYYETFNSSYAKVEGIKVLGKSSVNLFMLERYANFSSVNAQNNDCRFEQLYLTNRALTVSFLLVSVLIFISEIIKL